MSEKDIQRCFDKHASWIPGLRGVRSGDDLLSRAARALEWAIRETDALPRDSWVWNGYAEKRVNEYRVNDFLSQYAFANGKNDQYWWSKLALALSNGVFIPEHWIQLHRSSDVRPEWIIYHALWGATSYLPQDVPLRAVLLSTRLWLAATPTMERIAAHEDGYIDEFASEFFTREWAAKLLRCLLACATA